MRALLHGPRVRGRSITAASLGLLALLGSFLVATPAQALNNTGTGGVFVPAAGRVLDTGEGIGGYNTPMPAKGWRTVKVTGQYGVPDDGTVGAIAVVATESSITTQGQLFGRPNDSEPATMMGIYGGENKQITSFSSVLAVNSDGTIQIQAETQIRLFLDVQGYYTANTDGTAAGGFVPMNGTRIVDTREGRGAPQTAVASGKSIDVQVGGTAGVPSDASGAIINMIAVNRTNSTGYLTPYPTGSARPANSFNYAAAVPTSMQAQVQLSSSGKITIFNANSTTDIVVEVQGYFTAKGKGGAVFTPGAGRVYDTRVSPNTIMGPNETRSIQVAGIVGVPVMGSGLNAVVLTLTALKNTAGQGNATVWADGTTRPGTTAINYDPTTIRTNTITVPLGTNGKIALNSVGDSTDYVIDVQGWYINPVAPTISCPAAYAAGKWLNSLPTSGITCTAHMPNTGDTSGTLDVSVNGKDTVETNLSGSAGTDLQVTIPAAPGWYDIDASSSYSGNIGGVSHLAFGLNDGAPSAALGATESANPSGFENLANSASSGVAVAAQTSAGDSIAGTGSIAAAPSTGVTISSDAQTTTDSDTGATTTTPASTVGLTLPYAQAASRAVIESPGVVSYDNQNGSTTLAVLKSDTSVQINTIISSASAPTRYTYSLRAPDGSSSSVQNDGSIRVTDSSGALIGGISPAWAIDASGAAVPTHYELNGTDVTQVVDTSQTTAFPIVADPWLGKALVAKAQWSYAYKNDPRLMVFPTTWGRIWTGTPSWPSHWAEALAKTPNYRSRANTSDMRNQLYCHLFLGAQYWKESYNLDTSLHRGSLNEYVVHRCN